MKPQSETLRVGSRAPAFDLLNITGKPEATSSSTGGSRKSGTGVKQPRGETRLKLEDLLGDSPVILEFLRGTW